MASHSDIPPKVNNTATMYDIFWKDSNLPPIILGILIAASLYHNRWLFRWLLPGNRYRDLVGRPRRRRFQNVPGPHVFEDVFALTSEPHRKLAKLSEKRYGKIFKIRLEQQEYIILSSYEVVREAFVEQGNNFWGRPGVFSVDLNEEKSGHDEYIAWETQRLFASGMLNITESSNLDQIIQREVEAFVNKLFEGTFDVQRCRNMLHQSATNIMCLLLFGRRFEYESTELGLLCELIEKRNKFYSNYYPRQCFAFPAKRENTSDDVNRELDDLKNQILAAIEKLLPSEDLDVHKCIYVQWFKDEQLLEMTGSADFSDEQLNDNLVKLLGAGSESIELTMLWMAKYLAAHPEVQEKAHDELDALVGPDCPISYKNHRLGLPYCMATMLEVLRIAPILPLGIARSNEYRTNLGDYHIAEHSNVIPNLWAVNRDPSTWTDPNDFRPERHLDGNVFNSSPRVVSFSAGPRSCLGKSIAQLEYFYYFTMLLRKFRMRGPEDGVIDFQSEFGITLRPVKFEVTFFPRVGLSLHQTNTLKKTPSES